MRGLCDSTRYPIYMFFLPCYWEFWWQKCVMWVCLIGLPKVCSCSVQMCNSNHWDAEFCLRVRWKYVSRLGYYLTKIVAYNTIDSYFLCYWIRLFCFECAMQDMAAWGWHIDHRDGWDTGTGEMLSQRFFSHGLMAIQQVRCVAILIAFLYSLDVFKDLSFYNGLITRYQWNLVVRACSTWSTDLLSGPQGQEGACAVGLRRCRDAKSAPFNMFN